MTNLQTLTLDQLSTISGGQTSRSGAPRPATSPTQSSTGSNTSGTAPRSAPNWANSVDITGTADTDNNWNLRVQGEHKFNDQFTIDGHVQTGARSGRSSTEVGAGLHFRF